jgi:hypothetical protein
LDGGARAWWLHCEVQETQQNIPTDDDKFSEPMQAVDSGTTEKLTMKS